MTVDQARPEPPASLGDRLRAGDVLVLDGGTGTELQRRGVEMDGDAWTGTAMRTAPDALRAVHAGFVRAGADIVIANTFASAPHVLRHAGIGAREARGLNRAGCVLARQAVRDAAPDRPVLVAGALSSFRAGLRAEALPAEGEARASYRAQADALAEAGCDLLVAEMMQDTDLSPLAVEAAVATGLPVWIGFSARTSADGLLGFGRRADFPFDDVLAACLGMGGQAAGIMHTDVGATPAALEALKAAWRGPLFAYPHSGRFEMPRWRFDAVIPPEAYAVEALRYLEMGAQAIGCCCGMGPEHVAALKAALPDRRPARP